jgi:hypothetical protein
MQWSAGARACEEDKVKVSGGKRSERYIVLPVCKKTCTYNLLFSARSKNFFLYKYQKQILFIHFLV